jgi:hypothetical protein
MPSPPLTRAVSALRLLSHVGGKRVTPEEAMQLADDIARKYGVSRDELVAAAQGARA